MIGKVIGYVFDIQFSDMKSYHIGFSFHCYIFQKFLKISVIPKKVLSVHFKSSCRSWGILRNNRTWTQCPGKLFEKRNSPLHFVRFSETNLPYRIFSHKRGIWDAHISHNPNEWSVEHATFVHVLFEHWRFTWLGQFWSPLLVPDKFSISSRIRFPSYLWFKLNESFTVHGGVRVSMSIWVNSWCEFFTFPLA